MLETEKVVYVKFQEPETFRENGRHIFAILNAFAIANYDVYLCSEVQRKLQAIFGQSISDFPPPARLAMTLPDLKIVDSVPSGADKGIYVFDREDKNLKHLPWRKRLKVKFDMFSPYRFSKPIIMPYAVHPMHAMRVIGESLKLLRASSRKIRVLFAGDLEGYKRRWIRFPYEKLSRVDVISALKARLGESLRLANTSQDLHEILDSTYTRQFVLVDNDGARIEWSQWVDIIAQADFFLCPPGIVMPMCHNIVEAMAVGTIPITSYPEWFTPKLEHMKNCIVFDDENHLIEKVELALQMSESELNMIRENAMKYHELHLRPETFITKVEEREEDRLNILMYSEYNVAKKSAKLNKNSVLIRGESTAGEWAWLANSFR